MRKIILLCCFILAAVSLAAYDSPAPGGKITASFGSESKGQFNTGIDINAEEVFAAESGEVLYYGDNLVAVAHADSILTIYSNVAVSEALTKDIHVNKGQLLGKTKEGSLHFALYDLEMEQYINPLLMTDNIKRSELPKVKGLSYDTSGGMLSVYMSDRGLLGLYKVQVSVDGQVVRTLGFRTLCLKDGVMVLDREAFEYGTLYGRQGAFTFPDIQLKSGDNSVDIIVTDFYGKKVVFHGRITV
ncbi:MAG: M23 family metallopeptidase [Spirochaetia bacterium]|nr:M23 family metallopeptidase [Spirochaetia bacterium]